MTGLLAEFREVDALKAAIRRAREAGWRGLDAHTPFSVPGLEEALGLRPTRLRAVMLAGGALGAALAFVVQWYSDVFDYPIETGSRPLFSWQTFVVSTFEFAILCGAVSGFLALLWSCGLPRPHRPVFAAAGFERASQDRFFLHVDDPQVDLPALVRLCDGLGAVTIQRVPQ